MTKPRLEVEEKTYYRDVFFLYDIMSKLKTLEEVKSFFKDILTSTEIRMLKRRWHIAELLSQGLDVRTVAYNSKTSTQTVSKIKKILEEGRGGLRLAIDRMHVALEKQGKTSLNRKQSSKFVKGWFK